MECSAFEQMASGHVVAVVERDADAAGFLAEDEQSENLTDAGEQEEPAKWVVVHGARNEVSLGRDGHGRGAYRLRSVKPKGDVVARKPMRPRLPGSWHKTKAMRAARFASPMNRGTSWTAWR
jgi:hypothetical protein